MPEDSNIMASVLAFFKGVDDKLDKLAGKQDTIKDDVADIKTQIAILKETSVTTRDCEDKHSACILKITKAEMAEKPRDKPFWIKELTWQQTIAWCCGIALILLVLMGAAKVIDVFRIGASAIAN